MAGSVSDYIQKRLKEIDGIGTTTASRISSYFETITDFKNAEWMVFNNIPYQMNGVQRTLNISDFQLNEIKIIQNSIDDNQSLPLLYSDFIIRDFVKKVYSNIDDISLDTLNCNPFLGTALNLSNNPTKFFKFNVWAFIQRSIVTSFGSTLENLLLYCSENVKKGTAPDGGEKWDLLKNINDINNWLEIKSGPNDMDKTQILRYRNKMQIVENKDEVAFFGFTYGNIEDSTVTLGLLNTYIDNWEDKVKIGGELWDFLSAEEGYAGTLINLIRLVSADIFYDKDIIELIELKTDQIIKEFQEKYENLDDYLSEQY